MYSTDIETMAQNLCNLENKFEALTSRVEALEAEKSSLIAKLYAQNTKINTLIKNNRKDKPI